MKGLCKDYVGILWGVYRDEIRIVKGLYTKEFFRDYIRSLQRAARLSIRSFDLGSYLAPSPVSTMFLSVCSYSLCGTRQLC